MDDDIADTWHIVYALFDKLSYVKQTRSLGFINDIFSNLTPKGCRLNRINNYQQALGIVIDQQ